MTADPVDILLVEDHPSDAELTLYVLRKQPIPGRIEVVRDGAEALDYMFCSGAYAHRRMEDSPRVVLLDLKLPKVDGLEVLRRIKAHPHTRSIPVTILTSSQEERDIVASYRLGANSYVVKPVEFEQFATAVRQLGLYWLRLNQAPPVEDEACRG
jgi:two-component system response regulator